MERMPESVILILEMWPDEPEQHLQHYAAICLREAYAELDKSKDLIERMLPLAKMGVYGDLNPFRFCNECRTMEPHHDRCESGKVLDEAEALTKEG